MIDRWLLSESMINDNTRKRGKHPTCEVPRCKHLALYIEYYSYVGEEGIHYCSLHTNGKATNLANWIITLGIDMGVPWHIKDGKVEFDNGY